MRLVGAALALALAAVAAAPASAQSPGPPLAAGETLLEIQAEGASRAPADLVLVRVPIQSSGPTAAEARAANAVLIERVSSAARTAGVAPADIRVVPTSRMGFAGNEALEALIRTEGEAPQVAVATIEIRLRNPAIFEEVRRAMEQAGARNVPEADYRLADPTAQRRAAKAEAIRRAREEAAAYAERLGMSVGRVLRVSERAPVNFPDFTSYQDMLSAMAGGEKVADGVFETRVRVAVDFALVSRR